MSESRNHFSVIHSHVAKHHAFQTALAALEVGALDRFITAIYYNPKQWPFSWVDRVFSSNAPDNILRLRGFRMEQLDDRVISLPWLGLTAEAIARFPSVRGTTIATTAHLIKNELFDRLVAKFYVRPCDIFHGGEGCSMFSLEKARVLGSTTVLEQMTVHIDHLEKVEYEEAKRLGLSLSREKKSSWYTHAVKREHKEWEVADYIFVGLEFVKQTMIAYGIPESKIFVIPLGADIENFRPIDRSSRGSFTILYVGTVSWVKGLHYLLDSYARIRFPDTRLVIIGREDPHWGKYFRERFAAVPNLEWIPGVPHSEISRYYGEADVLAFPSLVGGVGQVVYEAMSTGLPVVVSDGDVVIRDGIDGLVAPRRDVDALEDALVRIYKDRELRLRLGQNAAERAHQFSWGCYRRGVVQAYKEILRGDSLQ